MYRLENKKILFYGDINFKLLPCLGFGSQGDVYKIKIHNKNYALKVFNGLENIDFKSYEEKLDINIDSYISPLKLLYINDIFSGYLMNYCKGKDLYNRKLNITIDRFVNSYIKLFEDTKKLSELKYTIIDTYSANTMYNNGFKIIDIDDFKHDASKTVEQINELNIKTINELLVEIFITCTGTNEMFIRNFDMKSLMKSCNSGKISFEEFFYKMRDIADTYAEDELTKVNEIGKILRKRFYR